MLRKLLVFLTAIAVSLLGTVPVFAQSAPSGQNAGAVYLMNNAAGGNQVMVYSRSSAGSLSFAGSYATGGSGSGVGLTVPPDPLGSQDSIIVSPNGKWVIAVNAGSNDVSVFRVVANGLLLTDRVNSGGQFPVSVAYRDGVVYVLNAAGDGNITGFRLTDAGKLHMLRGSARSLNAATPNNGSQPNILEAPGEVGFSSDGNFLVVTDKGGVSGMGFIRVFKLRDDLPAPQPVSTQTAGPVPFAFTFDRFGHLVVVDAAAGSVTSYSIQRDGSLATNAVAHTGQAATCWIDGNSRFIYTDNTGSGTLSGFKPMSNGGLVPLTADSIVATTGAGTLPLDMGVSRDGRFVYSLETGVGKIGVLQINSDGSLTNLGMSGSYPAIGGFQGIAVY
jgi:6-phosphogluconolactonase